VRTQRGGVDPQMKYYTLPGTRVMNGLRFPQLVTLPVEMNGLIGQVVTLPVDFDGFASFGIRILVSLEFRRWFTGEYERF
jgi:hypothetical protein